MKLEKAISKVTSKLIKLASEKGLYENFGQKEVRQLEDKFINCSDYTPEMNNNRKLLQRFEDWCMNYCG